MSDISFIKYLFNSYVGRDPTTIELGEWTQEYNKLTGDISTRKSSITEKFKQSDVYLNSFVNQLYTKYYHRSPTTDEQTTDVTKLKSGELDIQSIVSRFETSIEYHIVNAYNKYLSRDPETEAIIGLRLAHLTPQMNECLKNNTLDICDFNVRNSLKNDMISSKEYKSKVVERAYTTYLDRQPTTDELTTWTNAFTNNLITEQHIILYLKTSDEYKTKHSIDNLFTSNPTEQSPFANYNDLLDVSNKKMSSYASELERQSANVFDFSERQKQMLEKNRNLPTTEVVMHTSGVRDNGVGYLDRTSHSCIDGYAMSAITWQNLSGNGLEAKTICKKIQQTEIGTDIPSYVSNFKSVSKRSVGSDCGGLPPMYRNECLEKLNVIETDGGGTISAKNNRQQTYDKIKPFLPNSSTLIESFSPHPTIHSTQNDNSTIISNIQNRLKQYGQQIKKKIHMYEMFKTAYNTNTNDNGTTNIPHLIDDLSTTHMTNNVFGNLVKQLKMYSDLQTTNTDRYLYLVNLAYFNVDTNDTPRNVGQSVQQLYYNTHSFIIASPNDILIGVLKGLKTSKFGFVIDQHGQPSIMNTTHLQQYATNGRMFDHTQTNTTNTTHTTKYIWIISTSDDERLMKNSEIKFDIGSTNLFHITQQMYNNILNDIRVNSSLNKSIHSLKNNEQHGQIERFSVKYENIRNKLEELFKYIDQLIVENDKLLADISIDEINMYSQTDESDCVTLYSGNNFSTFSDPETAMTGLALFDAKCPENYAMKSYNWIRQSGKYVVKYGCCRI